MQEPASPRGAFAEHPPQRAGTIAGDVVITRDVRAIPPAGLDALGTGDQLQRATFVKQVLRAPCCIVGCLSACGTASRPSGRVARSKAACVLELRGCMAGAGPGGSCMTRPHAAPLSFRTMLPHLLQAIDRALTQARHQRLQELRQLRITTAAVLTGPP